MNRISSSSRSRITCAHAFYLGALLALIALAPAILPYGGRYVTRGDYIEQQLPFLLETRRILRGGLNSFSFNTFLGAPAVGSYRFYTLGSPFVWPLALLPQALVVTGGVAGRTQALVRHAGFAREFFRAVGSQKAFLQELPVSLNAHPQAGLWGAARAGSVHLQDLS